MDVLDIKGLGITDPSNKEIVGYNPGNNTGDPRFRILGNNMLLYISQTLIKSFTFLSELRDYCPKKIYEEFIANNIDWPPSDAMKAGSYFETQVLGSGANGARLTEYHKRGRKAGQRSVEQIRIDEQAILAKQLLENKGGIISDDYSNTQVKDLAQYPQDGWTNVKVFLTGEADLITPIEHEGRSFNSVCIDYKLTSDIRSTFSEYGWGRVFEAKKGSKIFFDMTQATVYHLLFDMPFAYWVFDYKSKGPENKLIFINHDTKHPDPEKAIQAKFRLREFHQTMRVVINEIIFNFQTGWKTNNNDYNRCAKCGVEDCPDRNTFNEI